MSVADHVGDRVPDDGQPAARDGWAMGSARRCGARGLDIRHEREGDTVSTTRVDSPRTGPRRRTPATAPVLAMSLVDHHGFGSPVVRDNGSVLPGDWADVPRAGSSCPRLGLACGASTRSEDINVRWKVGRGVRQPKDVLRRARLGMASPSGSGRRMSRQELAEAVNANLFATTGRVSNPDSSNVGKLERGEYRWPCKADRQAFRAVLGASADAELGFYIVRRTGDDDTATEHDHAVRSRDGLARHLSHRIGLPVPGRQVIVVYVIVAGHERAFAAATAGGAAEPVGIAAASGSVA